ncbi:MAG: class I SAM-dependent methyltransferase [Opitutaceae bacterium]
MDERTIAFYDRQAAATASRHRSLDTASWRPRFLDAFPRGGRVLDAGCGCGRDLALLLELGFDACGTEPSAGMRAEAERAYPALAGRIQPFALPLPDSAEIDGPFDGVVCSAVLMHVPPAELPAAMASLRRALRSGGRLWLTVPGRRPGLDAAERDEGGRLFRDLEPEPLVELCRNNGLRELTRWDEPDRLGRIHIRWHGWLLEAVETS